jgi:hypothetical protein
LIENDAVQSIGDLAVDLDAAVDGTGMHDQAIGLQKFGAFFGETEEVNVFADARKIFSALAFVLNAQKVDHIRAWKHVLDLMRNFDSEFLKFARHECARADQRDARAELEQTKNVRARHAAKQNIADDCHA